MASGEVRAIRSREDRVAGRSSEPATEPGLADGVVVEQFAGQPAARRRKARPDVESDGMVRLSARVSPEIRSAAERARYEFNMTFSALVEESIRGYLETRGFRI